MTKARELLYTGNLIDAAEAKRIDLVNEVVPTAELDDAAAADMLAAEAVHLLEQYKINSLVVVNDANGQQRNVKFLSERAADGEGSSARRSTTPPPPIFLYVSYSKPARYKPSWA